MQPGPRGGGGIRLDRWPSDDYLNLLGDDDDTLLGPSTIKDYKVRESQGRIHPPSAPPRDVGL